MWARCGRLLKPMARGYVVDLEDRDKRPARLKPGDPLTELRPAIPSPESVAATWEVCNSPPARDCHSATVVTKHPSSVIEGRGSNYDSGEAVAVAETTPL